ncbi:MAG TPA: energy transducer TonB [Edaphobacter sp.]
MIKNLVLAAVLTTSVFPVAIAQTSTSSKNNAIVSARLITYVAPIYPPNAQAGSFHGATFNARLGTNGRLHDLISIYPNDDFLKPALDAATQWIYEPYSIDGQPVEMNIILSVVFSAREHQTVNKPVRVSSAMMARLADRQVQPVSPHGKATGTVVLSGVIGTDGRVGSLQMLSGPKPLEAASLDAVQQWTYKPYLMDGVPTEIQSTFQLNF